VNHSFALIIYFEWNTLCKLKMSTWKMKSRGLYTMRTWTKLVSLKALGERSSTIVQILNKGETHWHTWRKINCYLQQGSSIHPFMFASLICYVFLPNFDSLEIKPYSNRRAMMKILLILKREIKHIRWIEITKFIKETK
jgi:hypothetical protein